MLVTNQKSVRVTKLENYGSALRPLYTIEVKLGLQADESPDAAHKLLTETGLIERSTKPLTSSNVRQYMQ